jgi:hypothetical protein
VQVVQVAVVQALREQQQERLGLQTQAAVLVEAEQAQVQQAVQVAQAS